MKLEIRLIATFLIILSTIGKIGAQVPYNYGELPYPADKYEELEDNVDLVLKKNLIRIISRNKKYGSLAAQKRLAVGIVDLRDPDNMRYASINGKHMMYAASLPKIAVLLTAMQSVKEGCLNYDNALKKDLRAMIAKSNNAATTRVIERVGFDKIAAVMQDNRYGLYDRNDGGGLWVGKKYAKAGKKNPDPIKGLSHAATVEQVCRYYTMLAYNQFVDSEFNAEMMDYLVDPQINHKFVKVLNKIAPDCDVYRKSGSWRNYHSDSALVYGANGRRYILVALIEDKNGSYICQDLVKKAEQALGLHNNILEDVELSTAELSLMQGD